MKMNLSMQELRQGRINQDKTKETPNSFAVEGGASVVNPTSNLAQDNKRPAGQMGERAMEMMQNPQEMQRTTNWMNAFKLSPTAMQNGWVAPPPLPGDAPPPQ